MIREEIVRHTKARPVGGHHRPTSLAWHHARISRFRYASPPELAVRQPKVGRRRHAVHHRILLGARMRTAAPKWLGIDCKYCISPCRSLRS